MFKLSGTILDQKVNAINADKKDKFKTFFNFFLKRLQDGSVPDGIAEEDGSVQDGSPKRDEFFRILLQDQLDSADRLAQLTNWVVQINWPKATGKSRGARVMQTKMMRNLFEHNDFIKGQMSGEYRSANEAQKIFLGLNMLMKVSIYNKCVFRFST